LVLVAAIAAAGCTNDKESRDNLTAGYQQLQNSSRDDEFADALARADAQIAKNPQGKGTADAYYLRGRALEQRVKHSEQQAASDLAQARQSYVEALSRSPDAKLEQYIRVSLGNVCYWQDDYVAALQEWSRVAGKLDDPALDAFAFYRVGLCEQRLGNFSGADQTFAKVAQKYPGTEAAIRAQQHSGFKFFSVQLATFANPNSADDAVKALAKDRVNPKHVVDATGKHIVMIGPANTYQQALQLKNRYVTRYPTAVIVP
jgi:outer membrane protein assembly factor BamD (BamD/ComL family)